MRLSSVRALKEELLEKTRRQHTQPVEFGLREARPARSIKSRAPISVLALGVAPGKANRDDYRLAVRIFRGQDDRAQAILREAKRYEGDLDVVTGVRYEPRGITIRPGGSCGHYRITSGTLGAFVEDDERYYILSNNHVLANSDDGMAGDPIIQPGPSDVVNNQFHVIGHLHRWEPLSTQRIDAALAAFSDTVNYFYPWNYVGIGQLDPRPTDDRFATRRVSKRGRTTAVTRGQVSAFELDGVVLNYGTEKDPWNVRFDDQIEIIGTPPTRPFSDGGDSGSLIVDRDTLRPYALLYGGGPDAAGIDRTVAHFIGDVLDVLGVRFVQ